MGMSEAIWPPTPPSSSSRKLSSDSLIKTHLICRYSGILRGQKSNYYLVFLALTGRFLRAADEVGYGVEVDDGELTGTPAGDDVPYSNFNFKFPIKTWC